MSVIKSGCLEMVKLGSGSGPQIRNANVSSRDSEQAIALVQEKEDWNKTALKESVN